MINSHQLVLFYYGLFALQTLEITWYINRRSKMLPASANAVRWVFLIAYVMLAAIGIYARISDPASILLVAGTCLALAYYLMFVKYKI